MWLILADDNDSSAAWLYQRLKRRGFADLELVSSSAVAYNLFWNYRMSTARSDAEFIFGDGRKLRTDGITGVVNRLASVPADRIRAPFVSGHHTEHEQMAYFVSWMYGLPVPVINRPSAHRLTGAWRDATEWTMLASLAGLTPAPFCRSEVNVTGREAIESKLTPFEMPTQSVYVVGNRVVGEDVPKPVADACVKLAALARSEMLGFEFVSNAPRSWLVAGVSAFPDLRAGGDALADAIYDYMVQRSPVMQASA